MNRRRGRRYWRPAAVVARLRLPARRRRAGLLKPGAPVEALRTGRPGMAAVDVFDQIVAYAAGAPINVVNPSVPEQTRGRT